MLGDILFTLAALGFTYSSVPQILKLYKIKNSTGISYSRHKILLICIVITIIACVHTKLWLSTIMNSVQLIFVVVMMWQIKRYRKKLPEKLVGYNAGKDRYYFNPTNEAIGYNAGCKVKK